MGSKKSLFKLIILLNLYFVSCYKKLNQNSYGSSIIGKYAEYGT